jgi:hypothetical protein
VGKAQRAPSVVGADHDCRHTDAAA